MRVTTHQPTSGSGARLSSACSAVLHADWPRGRRPSSWRARPHSGRVPQCTVHAVTDAEQVVGARQQQVFEPGAESLGLYLLGVAAADRADHGGGADARGHVVQPPAMGQRTPHGGLGLEAHGLGLCDREAPLIAEVVDGVDGGARGGAVGDQRRHQPGGPVVACTRRPQPMARAAPAPLDRRRRSARPRRGSRCPPRVDAGGRSRVVRMK